MTVFRFANSWPKTDLAQLYKLVAVRLLELAHPQAQDIYRVQALSTLAKLAELSSSADDVLNGRYPKATITPMMQEVDEALLTDPIVGMICAETSIEPKDLDFGGSLSTEEIANRVSLWRSLLVNSYKKSLEDEIVATVLQQKRKGRVLLLTKLYVSHLVFEGFHRSYIVDSVVSVFFSQDIGRCTEGLLRKLFGKFSGKKIKYDVGVHVPESLTEGIQESFHVKVARTAREAENLIGFQNDQIVPPDENALVLFENAEAPDPYSAIKRIQPILSIPKAFDLVYPNADRAAIGDDCYVVNKRKEELFHIPTSEVLRPVHSFTSSLGYNSGMFPEFADFAWAGANWDDYEIIIRLNHSFESATAAMSTGNPQVQLVSIWSAFEALLPEPTKDEKGVRISHFEKLILPCVTRKFLRGKFRIFIDDVSQHLQIEPADLFPEDLERSQRPRALGRILQHDNDETERLFNVVSGSPLLCNRLFSLAKIVRDEKLAQRKILSHEKRVGWQINRIYRQRNQIVHTGRTSPFLPTLVENAFLYYRLVVRGLQDIYSKDRIYHADGALQLLQVRYEKQKKFLSEISKSADESRKKELLLTAIFD